MSDVEAEVLIIARDDERRIPDADGSRLGLGAMLELLCGRPDRAGCSCGFFFREAPF